MVKKYSFDEVKKGDLFFASYPDTSVYFTSVVVKQINNSEFLCYRKYPEKQSPDFFSLKRCHWNLGAKKDYFPQNDALGLSKSLLQEAELKMKNEK